MTIIKTLLDAKPDVVHSVQPEESVYTAIQVMARHEVGALLVFDDDESLTGILSERDYARKVILQGRSSWSTSVGEIMTQPVVHVSPCQSVNECLAIMTKRRFRHLPVTLQGRVVGVVSIGDLVSSVIKEQESTIEELTHYITGT